MPGRLCRAAVTMMFATGTLAVGSSTVHATGLDDLIDRLGADNVPTGANVPVAQVEAPDGQGDYGPDQGNAMFDGVTFHEQSGPTSTSGHAQFVARRFYGDVSLAMDIDDVWLYDVNNWISAYLRAGSAFQPIAPPGGVKIFNHSWVAQASSSALNNDILRRVDFAIMRDDILMIVGVNAGGAQNVPLLSHNFNGLSVGKTDGDHVSADTLATVDGFGRMKPEIVADTDLASYSTGLVRELVDDRMYPLTVKGLEEAMIELKK